MTSRSDHAGADEIDNDPLPKWRAEIERDTKAGFRLKVFLPGDVASATVKPEDVIDARRLRSSIFAQTGHYLSEADGAQLFRLLPGLMKTAHDEYISKCKEAGTDPYQEAIPASIEFLTSTQLAERSASIQYAIDGILVARQPAILGGSKKTLKTTLALDLAVSLATGSKFLGEFDVLQRGRVGFISAESGEATIRETASRICRQKGYLLSSVDILFVFQIIKLSRAADLAGLRTFITQQEIKYLFIDPAYLLLFAGDSNGRQASNLFDVGSLLWPLTEIGQETGCTITLLHHANKSAGRDGAAIGLGDLSFAGFGEWARQWLIVSRLADYEPGSGTHQLNLEVGGSAGHSGRWAITVDEGRNEEGERSYFVDVKSISQHIDQEQEEARLRKAERESAKAEEYAAEVEKVLQKRFPDGATKNALKEWVNLSGTNIAKAIDHMLADDRLTEIEITKGGKTYCGFKLNPSNRTTRTAPDSNRTNPAQSGREFTRTTGHTPYKGVSGSGSLHPTDGKPRTSQASKVCPDQWQTSNLNGAVEQPLDF